MKYSPGDTLLYGGVTSIQVVGYVRYGGTWYYVLLGPDEHTFDVSQGDVEHSRYYTKIGEAA